MIALSHAPHAADEPLMAAMDQAHPTVGSAIREARKAGIALPTILAWLIQYGPQFVAFIKTVLDALKTPPPT